MTASASGIVVTEDGVVQGGDRQVKDRVQKESWEPC